MSIVLFCSKLSAILSKPTPLSLRIQIERAVLTRTLDSQKFVDLENGQRKNESPQEKPAKRPVSSDERTILLWMYALLFIFLGFTIIFMGSLTLNYYNMFQLCASDIMAFIVFFAIFLMLFLFAAAVLYVYRL
ncbi:uncharacterized protein SOCG_00791 [Schizosaccharomyces octosporus yFS286]|uniref:Uncharacterized protein n=1 Tax=Schizosaccharomyces octosporus (strain yFS286) TaxID=483514 RepID=S9RG39_SCHOY|nr:uncharacterized protein SOCG_00791 [Schizosaccharomyces octosporus yFS286]EPX73034.1 hypothetical protein SOCG_00791 [Schizosaccharomyces octosporus yFS286]